MRDEMNATVHSPGDRGRMAALLALRVAGVVLLLCGVVASDSVAAEVGSSKSAGHESRS